MSKKRIKTSVTPEAALSSDNSLQNNYSRWMTDMASAIARLKLHQLAIPGAHNSGVDNAGKFDVGKSWAVCQSKTFPDQLAAGARYLDLRLVDKSYKKDIGGSKKPIYKFIEVLDFRHGIVSVGRTLEKLIRDVDDFAIANPGEIIFIDFHHYDRGRNYAYNSLERVLAKFSRMKDRLIPPSAMDLSISDIRRMHPGCNIILCLDHNYPQPASGDKWPDGTVRREQIWKPLRHIWTASASEENVKQLVIETMASPPLDKDYLVLSAAASTHMSIPIDLSENHPIRTETFKAGFQNAKIVMVDFIESPSSRVGVVDRCIELNRLRAADYQPPSTPTNFVVTTKNVGQPNGQFPNTLVFNWDRSVDDLGVRHYHIFRNGKSLAATSSPPYEHKNFDLRNYEFSIKAIDNSGNQSAPSEKFDLIQDTVPPTTPGDIDLHLQFASYIDAVWDHSFDAAGVEKYEVYLNGTFLKDVPFIATNRASTGLTQLIRTEQYEVKIRAIDINGLLSEFTTATIYPRPSVINPRYSIANYDELTEQYSVNIIWDVDTPSTPLISYTGETKWRSGYAEYRDIYRPESGEGPTFNFQARQNEHITHRCLPFYGRYPVNDYISYDFVFDATPPEPMSNLKIISRTPSSITISWTPSTSANVTNYAISVNDEVPILVSESVNTYTFTSEEMSLDEPSLVEVWAINDINACSPIESLTTDVKPGKPGPITVSSITAISAVITWTAPQGGTPVTSYRVSLNGGTPITVTGLSHSFNGLIDGTSYSVEVRAVDAHGNPSDPASVTFNTPDETRPSKPGAPVANDIQYSSATLNWAASTDNVAVTGYEVWQESSLKATVTDTRYSATGLEANHSYNFRIVAVDAAGHRSEPALLGFRTKVDTTPPEKPDGLIATNVNTRAAILSWKRAHDDLRIARYEILKGTEVIASTETNTPVYLVNGLVAGTEYSFSVRALDAAENRSENSDPVVVKTSLLSVPKNLRIENVGPNKVTFVWDRPDDAPGLLGYRTTLRKPSGGTVVYSFPVQRVNATLLAPATRYQVSVNAYDTSSVDGDTLIFEIATTGAIARPSVPKNLRMVASRVFEWEVPDVPNDLLGYHVNLTGAHGTETHSVSTPRISVDAIRDIDYELSVTAFNEGGESPLATFAFTGDLDPASTPTNFRFTRGLIPKLEWDAPDVPVTDYRIILTGPGGAELPYTSTQPILQPVLIPLTRYEVRITARSAAGESLPLRAEITT